MAVFELDAEQRVLPLVGSCGIDAARFQEVAIGAGLIGGRPPGANPTSGFPATRNSPGRTNKLTACVPLLSVVA
jgi:hypothetical protein